MQTDATLTDRLRQVRNDATRVQALVESEYRFRAVVVDAAPLVVALDTHVVFDYLFPFPESTTQRAGMLDSARCVAALLDEHAPRFTLLPASVTELFDVLPGALANLRPLRWMSRTAAPEGIGEDKNEYEELARSWSAITARTFVLRRVRRVLASSRYVDAFDLLHAPELASHDSITTDRYYKHLLRLRESRGGSRHARAAFVDATNLAIVERAIVARLPLTFVTGPATRTVFDLVTRDSLGPASATAVLSPRMALFRFGLARASRSEIASVATELANVEETITSYETLLVREDVDSLSSISLLRLDHAEQVLADVVRSLADLDVAVEQAWEPPSETIPETVDLGMMSRRVREARDEARREIERLVALASKVTRNASALYEQLFAGTEFNQRAPSRQVLEQAVVNNLYLVEPGAVVGSGNVSVVGDGNAVAVHDVGRTAENGRTLLEALAALTAVTERSLLDAAAKHDALAKLSSVQGDLQQHGKLAARGKQAWAAVKEVLSSIPTAVAAWEAVAKLLK